MKSRDTTVGLCAIASQKTSDMHNTCHAKKRDKAPLRQKYYFIINDLNLSSPIYILLIGIILNIVFGFIYEKTYASDFIDKNKADYEKFYSLVTQVGDFACGSGLLNTIIDNGGKKDLSDFFKGKFDRRRYYKYYDEYASVYWGGRYNRQRFIRNKNLKMAIIESLNRFQETNFLTKLQRNEIEEKLRIEKGYIDRDFDNILHSGPVMFLYFKEERASRIVVDCGQSIESD